MRFIRGLLVRVALVLTGWTALLHIVTLVLGRRPDGSPAFRDLPWIFFPTFNGWVAYDEFWLAVHVLIFFVILGLFIRNQQLTQVTREAYAEWFDKNGDKLEDE